MLTKLLTLFLYVVSLFLQYVCAQSQDSLAMTIGTQVQASSGQFQPLWTRANHFGRESSKQYDQITWLRLLKNKTIGQMRLLSDTASALDLSFGGSLFNADHYQRIVLQEAFAQLNYKDWFLRAGRHRDLWDDLDPELSMGSLGTSGNALPIPKVTIGIDKYMAIPLTKGLLQFKGMMGHGWLGSNRFMESFLHEKSFYGLLNLKKLKLYGGVQHYVEWGGQRPAEDIYLDRSFTGFLHVLFVAEANDGSVINTTKRVNRAGDQRGLAELGGYYENEQFWLHVYNQTPFESGKGIDIRNMDRLLGLHIKPKHTKLQDVLLEFIYTKQMESFDEKEMQSYYNNGAMKTGWEYEHLVIGNPLFTNRQEAAFYLPLQPFDWNASTPISGNENIINNRLIGGNVAARVKLNTKWALRAKATAVKNYGARHVEAYYGNGEGLWQSYSLLETTYRCGSWLWTVHIAGDFGQLYEVAGGGLRLQYALRR